MDGTLIEAWAGQKSFQRKDEITIHESATAGPRQQPDDELAQREALE